MLTLRAAGRIVAGRISCGELEIERGGYCHRIGPAPRGAGGVVVRREPVGKPLAHVSDLATGQPKEKRHHGLEWRSVAEHPGRRLCRRHPFDRRVRDRERGPDGVGYGAREDRLAEARRYRARWSSDPARHRQSEHSLGVNRFGGCAWSKGLAMFPGWVVPAGAPAPVAVAQKADFHAEVLEWVIEPCMEVGAPLDVKKYDQETIEAGVKRIHIAKLMVASRDAATPQLSGKMKAGSPWQNRRAAYPIMLRLCLAGFIHKK
ncbi:MAG: hypothetical protein OXF79_21740 [Chloroflexi bacterium]|nr:hypothetical protein [Chloroflexota bacterium]